ncbi:hypothetical protein BHE74_00055943, partial [Ensete ventricosum]
VFTVGLSHSHSLFSLSSLKPFVLSFSDFARSAVRPHPPLLNRPDSTTVFHASPRSFPSNPNPQTDSDSDLSGHPLPSLLSLSSLKSFVLSFSDFPRSTVRPLLPIPRQCFLHSVDPFPVASDREVLASASRRAGLGCIPTAPPSYVLVAAIIKKSRIPVAPTIIIENLAVHLLVGVSSSRCRLQEGRASVASLQLRPFLSSSSASSRKAGSLRLRHHRSRTLRSIFWSMFPVLAAGFKKGGPRPHPYSSALLCLRRRIIKKGRIPTAPTPLIENLAVHLLVGVSSSRCRLQEGRAGLGRIPTAPPFYVLVAGIIKKGRSCRD